MNSFDSSQVDAILRSDLSAFIRKCFHTVDPGNDYLHNWHIDAISEYLTAIYHGDLKRLIINMPPRNLKSISASVAFPAWVLGKNPSTQFLCASYAQSLSQKHNQDCRLIIESAWFERLFPAVQLQPDQNTKAKFQTTMRGHRLATSVGSAVIGEGGDILIVDDALNATKALSDLGRSTMLDWFKQSFMTRLNNRKKGAVVVIEQRLHEEDLTGHLLKQGGWDHLNLPMCEDEKKIIKYGNFEYIRSPGESLHIERYEDADIEQLKEDLGEYAYASQYQQRPSPLGGGIFKEDWFASYTHIPEGGRIVQSWDTAYKDKQINDPSVCTTWMELDNKSYLLDMYKARLKYPALKAKVISMHNEWEADAVLIEDKASGQSLLQDLRQDSSVPVVAINPKGDKLTRASSSSIHFENGRALVPEQASWLFDFKSELMGFPNVTHDDIVDSTSQYLNWMNKQGNPSIRSF